jgi:AcrR family transcriptional regulator
MLDAARRLFTERGYEHVTMRAIAEAVEYSPAAIYSHFTDKTALFRELCESDFNQFTATFAPLLVISDPIERLLGMGEAYLQFGVAYPEHYKLLFMSKSVPGIEPANGHSPEPSENAYAFLLVTVRDALESGRARPEFDDAELLAQALWAGLHGVISLHLVKGDQDFAQWRPALDTARLLMRFTLEGIVRPDDPARQAWR